uniref:Uncharacterized protein n=1 Tax=viral metagenome TaxID=1070528 RepID=A0A6M3KL41_9ZZZZ
MPETPDVTPNPSSALGEAIASSPEALEAPVTPQDAQTPPAETEGVSQEEEARVPYSRLKEVVDEKNWLKQQLELQLQNRQQPQPQQPTQPQQEMGNTPEEREFWATQRRIAREEAEKVSQQQLGNIRPVIDAGRMELAQLKVQQFRNSHPDVKANSPEEVAIAEKINMGYLPEDAYKVVMWESKTATTEKQVKQQFKQTMDAKKQANVEQHSIPSGSLPPVNKNLPLRDRIKAEADKLDWS